MSIMSPEEYERMYGLNNDPSHIPQPQPMTHDEFLALKGKLQRDAFYQRMADREREWKERHPFLAWLGL